MPPLTAIARKLRARAVPSHALACELALAVIAEPALADDVVATLEDPRLWVQRRAADALARISESEPTALRAFRRALVEAAVRATDSKLRWRLAQVLGRLDLTRRERAQCTEAFFDALDDRQIAAVACALELLSDFCAHDESLWPRLLPRLVECTEHGSPGIRARAKRLLDEHDRAQRRRARNGK